MLTINREEVGRAGLEARMGDIRALVPLAGMQGRGAAVCLRDPLDVLAAVEALRAADVSVLLMHGDTPLATASQAAANAGCELLLWGSLEDSRRIRPTAHDPGASGEELGLHEPSLLQYSSGTTGGPKLIRRAWTDIDREIEAYNAALGEAAGCRPVVLAPVSHSYGLLCGVLAAMRRGIVPSVVTNANPKFALKVIEETPEHLVYAVPLLFHVMTGLMAPGSRFHRVISSGAPLPGPLFETLRERSAHVMQQYGCTEAGCISVARSMQSGSDLGELLGYWRLEGDAGRASMADPAEIVVVREPDGRRIATGDLGSAQDGHLFYAARMDDVINVGGLKVFPLEVEERIASFPGVQEAVVYRGVHPVMGETVRAKAVWAPSGAGSQTSAQGLADDIRAWCREGLPAYKVPSAIELVEALPRTPTGKISRRYIEQSEGRVHNEQRA
ncbi:AMP-binding protein [Paenibacillus methanolicus]|uniref:Fatty-acyl-CoA synthase n=1 Tax=Paenibacillus methanolicus TaxID=582686 RepID=A0A5S5BTV9_9BACL|nr:AMP-binding protein [Paenibacillus methanolicus]TYP70615.1 fatty-acyl-CoA synthase [Paenibacillus methanolicus]